MKRYILILSLLLSLSLSGTDTTFCYGFPKETESSPHEEKPQSGKQAILIYGDIKNHPRTRSIFQYVEAYAYPTNEFIELCFNQDIGIVTITVSGPSGIESVTCDTASEFFVTIPVSFVPGQYFIEISGPEYEGYGQFEL